MNQIFYSPNKIFYRQIEAGGAAGCVRAVPPLSPLPRRGRCGDLGAAVTSGWGHRRLLCVLRFLM